LFYFHKGNLPEVYFEAFKRLFKEWWEGFRFWGHNPYEFEPGFIKYFSVRNHRFRRNTEGKRIKIIKLVIGAFTTERGLEFKL